jgi:hypothetical protein
MSRGQGNEGVVDSSAAVVSDVVIDRYFNDSGVPTVGLGIGSGAILSGGILTNLIINFKNGATGDGVLIGAGLADKTLLKDVYMNNSSGGTALTDGGNGTVKADFYKNGIAQ